MTPAPHSSGQPPFGISEDVFEAGARLYRVNCASCHGTPGQDAPFAKTLSPTASQLWSRSPHNHAPAVAELPPGDIFASIQNGVPHSAMPAYKYILTSTQIWQIALLLKNADQPLPEPVRALLIRNP